MKAGTRIGWILVAISLILSVWVIVSQPNKAASEGGFTTNDAGMLTAIPSGSIGDLSIPSTVDTDTVTSLADGLFNDDIDSIELPSTLTSASPSNFDSATSLGSITVNGTGTFHSYDGCLYQGTTLVYVPIGKASVNIEAGTTTIGADAFKNSSISQLHIPSSVTSIGAQNNGWTASNFSVVGDDWTDYGFVWATGLGYQFTVGGGGGGTTYTVTFDLQGQGTNFTQAVADGGYATEPAAPTAAGYTFGGWFADAACTTAWNFAGNAITSDTTIYAKWTPGATTTYTITYYGNGGTSGGNATVAETVTAGSSVTLADKGFAYSGYTLSGWGTSTTSGVTNALGTTFTPTGNVNLYAQWTANGSGGGGSGGGSTTSYTVTYNANGGTGSMDAQSFTTGGNVVIKANSFAAPSGKYFTGWNTKADGSGTAYSAGATYNTAANLTLYAQWSSDVYTVTYNANGGAMPGSTTTSFNQSFAKGGSTKIAGKIFQRTGFDLDYWTTNSDGSGTRYNIDQTYSAQSNLTLYAHWTALNSQTGASGTTSNGTHAKDNTPATADGDIDPRIVLCVAVAALGIAIIVSSNRRKISYINHKKDRTEE